MSDDAIEDGLVPRRFWQRLSTWVVVGALGCMALFATCFLDVGGFLTGETDLAGNYKFEEELAEAEDAMTEMERVHARLFPAWLIAEANQRDEAAKLADLRAAVKDPELLAVLDDLAMAIGNGSIASGPAPVPDIGADAGVAAELPQPLYFTLLQRWNGRLKELGESFYITGSIAGTSAGPSLLCQFYRRLAEPHVNVQGNAYETVVLQRIDRTNLVESYLGVSERGGAAVVVTDRILDLATDSVWLILNAETMPDDPLDVAYGDAIRAEAAEGLSEKSFATLRETAVQRKLLLDTVEAALARASCGSTMRFGYLAWDGFDPRTLNRLDAYAERDKIQPCPAITFEEATIFRDTSEALRADDTKHALQELVAWLTRMIAFHEARHAADTAERGSHESLGTCPGCPARMHASTRAELSAYVATVAWSDSPATAMYQACSIRGGPHGRAMRFFNREIGRRCADPPPADLAQSARALEERLFGTGQEMALTPDFPTELEIHRYR